LLATVAALCGCRTGRNYDAADGPRFAGAAAPAAGLRGNGPDTIRVVSFNIKYSRHIDSAIHVLQSDTSVRAADVVLLQEMDEAGTRRIANALAMSYTYYPATYLVSRKKDFGNAVLSRWPIVADEKIVLPHHSRFHRTQRTATAATIRVRTTDVRVYSTHLGTMADVMPSERRNQFRALLADAAKYPHVVIGGDLNNHGVGRVASEKGYAWPTERGPRTIALWRWDHIFFRGLTLPDSASSGTVRDVRGASDHKPVWAAGIVARAP